MEDFSRPYKRLQYLGLWATGTADRHGIRDAMAILANGAGRCFEEDMRQRRELFDALEYLSRETGHAVYVNRFRKAPDEPNPGIRFGAAGHTCEPLRRRIGEFRGVSLRAGD